jgi:hypothetical protein
MIHMDSNQTYIKEGFKLVDVAHFLYENKIKKSDIDIIMKFMTKVK